MSSLYAWRGKTRRGDIRACGAHSRISNTDTKLLIYGLFQKGRVLAQDGARARREHAMLGIGNGRQPQLDNTERNHQGLDNAFVFLDTTPTARLQTQTLSC